MAHIKLIAALFICMAVSVKLQAQVADTKNPVFHSIVNIGLVSGSESGSLQLQTIAGVGYKNWFAGIGAGLDYYRYRTVPVFIDLRHSLVKTETNFLYMPTAAPVSPGSPIKKRNCTWQRTGLPAGFTMISERDTVLPWAKEMQCC